MFDRIGHINLVTLDPGVFKRPVEQTSGRADERMALTIFLISRLLTDKYHARACRAFAKNGLSGVFVEIAALAIFSRMAQ